MATFRPEIQHPLGGIGIVGGKIELFFYRYTGRVGDMDEM